MKQIIRSFSCGLIFALFSGMGYGAELSKDWQTIDAGNFTLKAPSGWKFDSSPFFKTITCELVGGKTILYYESGGRNFLLRFEKEEKSPDYLVNHENREGRKLTICISKPPGKGKTGIFVDEYKDQGAFTFIGENINASQQKIVLKIFRSIRFKKINK